MGNNYEVDLIDVQKFQVQKLGATWLEMNIIE